MSAFTKAAGLVAGLSTVAVISVAVAQGVEPDPRISNPALGAGQQSSQHTSMGETGVPADLLEVRTAIIQEAPPAPVAAAPQAAPAPEPVAAAPAPAPETTTMGAAPAPVEQPAPQVARADRN
jgi:hypothetical protein